MAYPDCNKGIRPLVNGLISPRVVTSRKVAAIYVLWSRYGCLDNSPRASFQPNHFVFLTNKLRKNLRQVQSMDGENISMPSLAFECETPTQEEYQRPLPEEGEVSQAPENRQKLLTTGVSIVHRLKIKL